MIPKRKKKSRQRRITINYLRNKKNEDSWTVGRKPGNRQKRKMLALAISVGVDTVMSGHTYMIGMFVTFKQKGGQLVWNLREPSVGPLCKNGTTFM